jgi:molecular chaperone DnaK
VLSEASATLAEQLYAEKPSSGSGESEPANSANADDENIVDAEFEEVDDDKGKRGE